MSQGVEEVVAALRKRVDPDDTERERLRSAADAIVGAAEEVVADLPVAADVLQVGSTARDTWISGDRDIDVFVRFPPDLPREDLETYGLEVGHAVLPEGREEFAEHPYVTGQWEGFDVDLVPCYAVDSAAEIRSAVDRTPFHTRYVAECLDDELAGEVRAFKQFCKGIGVYGSDLRTEGLSGYLVELLVCEHGSFRRVLEAVADWQPPVRLDIEDHGTATFEDALVVIDPTDPERNVAAVLSRENLARLQHHARAFLAEPNIERCFPDPPDPLDAAAVRAAFEDRGTHPVAVRFPTPDLVDDQLYPQLRRSLGGLVDELDRRGFDVLRSNAWASEPDNDDRGDSGGRDDNDDWGDSVLVAELEVATRPATERHEGPPVHVGEHARRFFETYADREDVTGPFVDGERYVVERPREFETARAFLESDAVFDVRLGTHVASALEDGYEVLVGADEVAELAAVGFGVDLAEYLDPRP